MDDPRSVIRERALGILRDIPELRDSPMLEAPLSDVMLRDSDRWLVVSQSQSLAIGGIFSLFPSLSSAAPFVIGDVGRIIGMWDLFRGHDYWERLIPIVSVTANLSDGHWGDPFTEVFRFSGPASDGLPSSASSIPNQHVRRVRERATELCEKVTVWSLEDVERFCVRSLQERAGHLVSFATFHPTWGSAAIEICRMNVQVDGVHDLLSDVWSVMPGIRTGGEIEADGRWGKISWSHVSRGFNTSFSDGGDR